jgi:lipid A 3-O-deacylase
MKFVSTVTIALLLAGAVAAQESATMTTPPADQNWVSQSVKKGAWELGLLTGGGSGLGKSDNTQFFYAGGRAGVILTGDHLPWLFHGNFEWAVDMMPLYAVLPPESAIYGGSFKPVIWQWNFKSPNEDQKKISPYVAAAGGIVFSHHNVPPGDTSFVNFTSQAVAGTKFFVNSRRAVFFEGSLGHLSSASLGTHNPGYNVTLVFTVGYTWFKRTQ